MTPDGPGDAGSGTRCRVCSSHAEHLGPRHSTFSGRSFDFARCQSCGYAFVENPRTDYALLYDEAYYAGRGADRLTSYRQELDDERSIRVYQWSGIVELVDELVGLTHETRWLDHGCGLGGVVRYAQSRGYPNVFGFDDGYAADVLARDGVPHITRGQFGDVKGSFDVVTSLDVIEHAVDPIALLEEVREFLKPGGTLLVLTGNAEPFRRRLLDWSYTSLPDVHVGVFEPETLRQAYRRAGLEPMEGRYRSGFTGVLRFSILKNLRLARRNAFERLVPWPIVCRVVDRRYRITRLPSATRP